MIDYTVKTDKRRNHAKMTITYVIESPYYRVEAGNIVVDPDFTIETFIHEFSEVSLQQAIFNILAVDEWGKIREKIESIVEKKHNVKNWKWVYGASRVKFPITDYLLMFNTV